MFIKAILRLVIVGLLMPTCVSFAQQRPAQTPPRSSKQPSKPTPPQQKPAAPKKPQTVENAKFHYKFTVPGDWEKHQQDDMVTIFMLPYSHTQTVPMNPGSFVVISIAACHEGATLTEQVDFNRKQGFSIPMDDWLRQERCATVRRYSEYLPTYIRRDALDELIKGQLAGRTNGARLYAIIMLGIAMKNQRGM